MMFAPVSAEERIGGFRDRERRFSLPWFGIVTAVAASLFLLRFEVGLDRPDGTSAPPTAPPIATAGFVQEPVIRPESGTVLVLPPKDETGGAPETPTVVNEDEAASAPPEKATAETLPVVPLPPVVADNDDPYQVRALAVGLHPGLSRAILMRLTKADFRNAAHAIHTALVRTPAGKSLVWPKSRSKDLVQFRVRFVPSISADCRRYIVEVIKDGWITTAQPMEKCGIKAPVVEAARR